MNCLLKYLMPFSMGRGKGMCLIPGKTSQMKSSHCLTIPKKPTSIPLYQILFRYYRSAKENWHVDGRYRIRLLSIEAIRCICMNKQLISSRKGAPIVLRTLATEIRRCTPSKQCIQESGSNKVLAAKNHDFQTLSRGSMKRPKLHAG